jgi:hypothetical protein
MFLKLSGVANPVPSLSSVIAAYKSSQTLFFKVSGALRQYLALDFFPKNKGLPNAPYLNIL